MQHSTVGFIYHEAWLSSDPEAEPFLSCKFDNAGKTVLMFLNEKTRMSIEKEEIKIGESMVTQSDTTKLLGMQIEDPQTWSEHIKVTIRSLNMRLFQIRRIIVQRLQIPHIRNTDIPSLIHYHVCSLPRVKASSV